MNSGFITSRPGSAVSLASDCAMGPGRIQHNKGDITYCWVKGLVKNRNERMIVTAFLHVVTEIEEYRILCLI